MNSSEDKRSFKRKKPFVNNGFRKPMQQEPRSRISHPQPPSAAKRPNNNSDFNKPTPELQQQQRNTNASSLESILKGKVIKEFVPMAQKEQKVSEPVKLANEPAKSKTPAPTPMLRPPMLVRTSRPPMFHQQQHRPLRQHFQPPYRQPPPIRPQPQPPRLQPPPTWNQQVAQGNPPQWIPQGAFYVPRLTPKPKITKPIWAVNNKTTHFRYDASFVAFAQTFKAEDFDKLAINALSAITPDIESDHKRTCYDFVSTIRLWYKTVDYLRRISPKTPQQQIQLGYLTHTDQTDLLAQFMLDHVKRCDHCMYICMARLNKRATEPVFSIAQNHSVPLTDISGRIHPDPVEQFYQLKLQEQHQAHQQLLHQQQPLPQLPSDNQGTSQPLNQSLQMPVQQQHVQHHHVVQQHFPPMQQMAQHHFPHQPNFIAQIHPHFVVPLAQPIFPQTGHGTPPHVPQQQVVAEQHQQQHPVPN